MDVQINACQESYPCDVAGASVYISKLYQRDGKRIGEVAVRRLDRWVKDAMIQSLLIAGLNIRIWVSFDYEYCFMESVILRVVSPVICVVVVQVCFLYVRRAYVIVNLRTRVVEYF